MKKALAAFALLCALTSLAPPSRAQTSISPSAGAVVYVHFPGVPTGGCSTEQQAKNEATGDFYVCFGGAWLKVAGGGASSLALLTGGVAPSGPAFDFSNVILVQPQAAGYSAAANGRCGFDTTANMWHCWDGVDNFKLLMPSTITPLNNDMPIFSVSGSQYKLGRVTPVGGGAAPLWASGISTALNGDFLHQDNFGIWRAITPGVPGRTATTVTEPILWTSGTGDRSGEVSLTNAALVTSAIPQCGVAPAVSNPYSTVWITGAAGAKFTSTVSNLNGIAPATGITYPGNTRVDITCPDNANYTLLASRAVKGGTNITEVLNADGTVTFNAASGGAPALSAITAATGTNTIANGNFPQIWNWAQTTDLQSAFNFGESAAATGGTVTGLQGNQALVKIATLAGSTSAALSVTSNNTSTLSLPALQASCTANNAGLSGRCFSVNVINTSSASFYPIQLLLNGTNKFNIDLNGAVSSQSTFTANGTGFLGATYTNNANTSDTTFQGGIDGSTTTVLGGNISRGADNPNTGAGAGGGFQLTRPGLLTGASPAGTNGVREAGDGYLKGATVTKWSVQCMDVTAFTVVDCPANASTSANIVGVASSNATPVLAIDAGIVPINATAAVTVGHTVCLSASVAGQVTDSGGTSKCATAGYQIGVVVAISGTYKVANGAAAPANVTATSTLPLVHLAIE